MSRGTFRKRLGGLKAGLASGLGRLSRLGIGISGRRLVELCALLLILFIAFTLRFLPIRWGSYFSAYDPYFQYRMADYVVENGFPSWFTWHDDMTWYPMGRDVARTTYPGTAFSGAFLYLFLRTLGVDVSLMTVCLFFPVLMGTLTCLIIYFFGKDIGGKEVGLFASFFLAINTAFIGRTSWGFFDNETIGVPGMVLTFLCFLRSLEGEKPFRSRLLYSLIAGLSLCYVTGSWGATRYAPALLAIFTFLMVLKGDYSRNLLFSYSIPIVITYAFSLLLPINKLGMTILNFNFYFGIIMAIDSIVVLGLIPLLVLYDLFKHAEKTSHKMILVAVMIVALVGGLWFLESRGYISRIAGKFLSVINPFTKAEIPLIESVAEHRMSSWASFFRDFGVTLSLSLVGIYFSLRRIEPKKVLVLLYFITSLYFSGSMIRLTLILSAASSLMAAYGLVGLVRPFMGITLGEPSPQETRRRRRMPRMTPELGAVFLIILFLISVPTIVNSAKAAYSPGSLACSGVPGQLGRVDDLTGGYPQDWKEALDWMRSNLDSDTVLVAWWDYGYWLTGIGNIKTLADGSTWNGTQISSIAKMYMYNQNKSLEILQRYDADYILVFVTLNPQAKQYGWPPTGPNDTFEIGDKKYSKLWPLGDNVKWHWMAKIAGLNASDYLEYSSALGDTVWTDKFKETTIYHLMFGVEGLSEHFQLAFYSTYGFVLIYRIIY